MTYYEKNKQKCKEQSKKWYHTNKDANREKVNERQREYYRQNPEKRRVRNQKYYQKNKERLKDRSNNYYKEVSEKRRNYLLKVTYDVSSTDYDKMFKQQNGCCAICGNHQDTMKPHLSIDHNHKTGKNRGLLCHRCNLNLGITETWTFVFAKQIELYLTKFGD